MQASCLLHEALERSGLTKSALSEASGVSRSLLDDYLKGRSDPSVSQLDRLVRAAGMTLTASVGEAPRKISPEFLAVLEFGDLFPRKDRAPLINVGPLWRSVGRASS